MARDGSIMTPQRTPAGCPFCSAQRLPARVQPASRQRGEGEAPVWFCNGCGRTITARDVRRWAVAPLDASERERQR